MLVTGSIWGRPTWNTWWEWGDVRLNDPCSILMILGYIALRQVPANPDLRAKRSSVVGIIAAVNIPIVNRSVEWWENNTLHQKSSLTDGKLENPHIVYIVLRIHNRRNIVSMVDDPPISSRLVSYRDRNRWDRRVIEERLNEGISVDGNSNYQPKDEVQ